jgi:glycosyltransferase involved in cell wall biosynthesis
MQKTLNKINVLQIITGLGVGGAERVVMDIATRLSNDDFVPVIVVLSDELRMLEQYPDLDFKIYSLKLHKNPWSFVKAVLELTRIIYKEKISLIHAHMFHALIFGLIGKLVKPDLKLVFTSHNTKGFTFLRKALVRLIKVFRNADVIFMKGQHHQMNAGNTFVIPNGVRLDLTENTSSKHVRNHRHVFLFVGRLEPAKDPLALIRAFSAMQHKECELWMAGDGFLRPDIEREIEILGINERVRLLGIRTDVRNLLKQADCFVMSSRWEGLPLAILEAGAAALPVVATPVGAIPTLLDSSCGYMVDVSVLQSALDSVIDDYAGARRKGELLRNKIINNFSLDHMYQEHIKLYRNLIGNSGTL